MQSSSLFDSSPIPIFKFRKLHRNTKKSASKTYRDITNVYQNELFFSTLFNLHFLQSSYRFDSSPFSICKYKKLHESTQKNVQKCKTYRDITNMH